MFSLTLGIGTWDGPASSCHNCHSPFPSRLGCQPHTGEVKPLNGTLENADGSVIRKGPEQGGGRATHRLLGCRGPLLQFRNFLKSQHPSPTTIPPILHPSLHPSHPLLLLMPLRAPPPTPSKRFSHPGCHSQSSLHRRPGDKGNMWVRWDPQAYPTHQRGGHCRRSLRAAHTQDFCVPRGRQVSSAGREATTCALRWYIVGGK